MRAYLNTINIPWHAFDELMTDFPFEIFNDTWRARTGKYPRVNVWENEKGLVVETDVAGVEPEKLDVSVDANVLTFKGEKESVSGARTEFQRSFNLPFELDSEHIKATAKNGVLTASVANYATNYNGAGQVTADTDYSALGIPGLNTGLNAVPTHATGAKYAPIYNVRAEFNF